MTDRLPHILRVDAQDNRDRVLEAARALFSEHGIDVTMREIARRAEVGPATLYRRFPTKQILIDAAFSTELRACEAIVDDGCADSDPWRGFCAVIEGITVLSGKNQGFVDVFMTANPQSDAFDAHRAALLGKLAGLAKRARLAGGLRQDFVIDDLVLILIAARGLSSISTSQREVAARRYAALIIDSLRESGAKSALPRAPRVTSHVVRAHV